MQIVLSYEYDFSFMSIKYKYRVQIKMAELIPFLMPWIIIKVTLLWQIDMTAYPSYSDEKAIIAMTFPSQG